MTWQCPASALADIQSLSLNDSNQPEAVTRRSVLQRLRSLVQPPWKSADELSSAVRSGGPFFWMEMENTNTLAPDTGCALKPVEAGSRASQPTRKDVKCLSACKSPSMIESA